MPTHKSIKALCRKLIDGDVYHASRLITLERHKPTQPRMPPISIGGGIGEQRGENKRIVFTLN